MFSETKIKLRKSIVNNEKFQVFGQIMPKNSFYMHIQQTISKRKSEKYRVSHSALAKWIKQYSEIKVDGETVVTAEQIKALQKRNAQLEEENLILKKAIAIFTPHSDKD